LTRWVGHADTWCHAPYLLSSVHLRIAIRRIEGEGRIPFQPISNLGYGQGLQGIFNTLAA